MGLQQFQIIPVQVLVDASFITGVDFEPNWHYDRNSYNNPPLSERDAIDLGWEKLPPGKSIYHQFGDGYDNSKYVSPDGHEEAVYTRDGVLDTSPENQGTYNYFGPDFIWGVPHLFIDVIPYNIFGNSYSDSTPLWDRISGARVPTDGATTQGNGQSEPPEQKPKS